MFIDLVGSTTLSQQLDPEDYHARVVAYQTACHQVVARYDGHIAQYLGDGVLVYFGYPTAHEDDAVRAVRSGLEIIAAVDQLKLTPPLQVRIGIHTGPVVVGEIGAGERTERLALGETPNIAARVQGHAHPDEVMISTATYHLIEGLFTCEDRGRPKLKGVATPLTLHRVVKESNAHNRFEVVVRKGLTPLIGREHEYGLLRDRWQRVRDGAGQVVLLRGEPGIGKSRLVEALKETVEHEGARCLEFRCSPYAQNSALQPVIEHLRRVLKFQPTDTVEKKLNTLEQAGVGAVREPPLQSEVIPLLATLLSLPHPDGYPPITLSPQKQKEKTQEALVAWLCEEARQQAVTYAWEDLHWADPSTLELLTLFLAQVPTTRLLAVLTYRPEFIPPWGSYSYLSQLTLSRLGQTHVEVMVEKVTGDKTLPQEVVRQIASKTDGVPLFVEELTKMVVESNLLSEIDGRYELNGPLPPLAIPSTLQDSLMARLDRLAAVREIAQIGATLGREFTYELLRAVSPLPEDTLRQGLKQLVEAELVFQSGIPPQARYLFKHALVQDTAYQSLLKSRRQQLHQQVAQVLEGQFPQTVETQPELIAHHYTEAGLATQAIPYWQQAGERAIQRSAHVEASTHLTKGLELLQSLPDTSERAPRELTLQLTLGATLQATKGYTAPQVESAYTRARALCRQVGETPQLFYALSGLRRFYYVQARLQAARELNEDLLRLAQQAQDVFPLTMAYQGIGATLFSLGELVAAREHFEQSLALYDPQRHRAYVLLPGEDPGVVALSYVSLTLMLLGYPDQALRKSHEALTLAQQLAHPYSTMFALSYASCLHQGRREEHPAQEQAEAALTLSTEQGFAQLWVGRQRLLRGWALVMQGQAEEEISQMRHGLAARLATGAALWHPYHLALLAETYGKVRQTEEGLTVLTEAMAVVSNTEERYYEAELYRLRGELTLQQFKVQGSKFKVEEAEECFLKAIEIACQ
jgi:class 3 adenylate cyclase/predicted ATPase/energy-coupling factor transporter ATP-binding protein EcfA2